jgi:hypothetical protein
LRCLQLKEVRDKCYCSTFIIAGGGPYFAVLGAILTDKFVVQRLTSLEWLGMGRVFEDKHPHRIAQVFESLRGALQELDEFYDKLDEQDLELVDGFTHDFTHAAPRSPTTRPRIHKSSSISSHSPFQIGARFL